MERYYQIENTPLAYHKFVRYFWLPLVILIQIWSLIRYIPDIQVWNGFYAIDIIYVLLAVVLAATAFYGFFTWSSYAWLSYMCLLGVMLAYQLLCLTLNVIWEAAATELASSVGGLIGLLLHYIPASIYYLKRKPLFFPANRPAAPSLGPSTDRVAPPAPAGNAQPRFCRRCQARLGEGSRFCHRCGTEVMVAAAPAPAAPAPTAPAPTAPAPTAPAAPAQAAPAWPAAPSLAPPQPPQPPASPRTDPAPAPSPLKQRWLLAGLVLVALAALFWLSGPPLGNPSGPGQSESTPDLIKRSMPLSGQVFYSKYAGNPYTFHVENNRSVAYYMKFTDPRTNEDIKIFFIRPHSVNDITMPQGRFELRYASGATWYGEADLFGPDTIYARDEEPYPFGVGDDTDWQLILGAEDDPDLEDVNATNIKAEEF